MREVDDKDEVYVVDYAASRLYFGLSAEIVNVFDYWQNVENFVSQSIGEEPSFLTFENSQKCAMVYRKKLELISE